jgi:hypothetical protein
MLYNLRLLFVGVDIDICKLSYSYFRCRDFLCSLTLSYLLENANIQFPGKTGLSKPVLDSLLTYLGMMANFSRDYFRPGEIDHVVAFTKFAVAQAEKTLDLSLFRISLHKALHLGEQISRCGPLRVRSHGLSSERPALFVFISNLF